MGKYADCKYEDWGEVSMRLWRLLDDKEDLTGMTGGFAPLARAVTNWHHWRNDADVLALASQVVEEG